MRASDVVRPEIPKTHKYFFFFPSGSRTPFQWQDHGLLVDQAAVQLGGGLVLECWSDHSSIRQSARPCAPTRLPRHRRWAAGGFGKGIEWLISCWRLATPMLTGTPITPPTPLSHGAGGVAMGLRRATQRSVAAAAREGGPFRGSPAGSTWSRSKLHGSHFFSNNKSRHRELSWVPRQPNAPGEIIYLRMACMRCMYGRAPGMEHIWRRCSATGYVRPGRPTARRLSGGWCRLSNFPWQCEPTPQDVCRRSRLVLWGGARARAERPIRAEIVVGFDLRSRLRRGAVRVAGRSPHRRARRG